MKGMIIETFLSLQDGLYPFDQLVHPRTTGFVQELQYFPSKQTLASRRSEIQRNTRSFQPHSIIKLLRIYQENLCLHYIYEYVQLSLSGYIKQQLYSDQHEKYKEMTAKLLFRSIVNEINSISNELAKLRVETEFKYEMFGVRNNRVTVFVCSQYQAGRKSEVMLKEYYRGKREGVVKTLEEEFMRIIGEIHLSSNCGNKGNRMAINQNMKNHAPEVYSQQNQSSFWLNDTNFNCETKDTNFKHKEKERRYSQTKWDASEWKNLEHEPQKLRNTQSPSFVNQVNLEKPKMAASKHFQDSANQEDDFDGRSYCHSKSIRIQLQKNKKKRKDSYKVKVITCHQYQMDDIDPQNLFSKCNLSESSSSQSDAPTRSKKPTGQQQFKDKVKRAATRARDLLNGYLHQRRHTRK